MTRIEAGASQGPRRRRALEIALALGLVLLISVGAVVASAVSRESNASASLAAPTGPASELKLGYFGNITHAPALMGVPMSCQAKADTRSRNTLSSAPHCIRIL